MIIKLKHICLFTNSMFKVGGEQRITTMLVNNLITNNYNVTIIIKCNEEVDYNLYNLSKKANLMFLNYNYEFRLNNFKFFEFLRNINRKTGIFKENSTIIRRFFCSNKMIKDLINIFNNNHLDFESHYKIKGSGYCNEEKFIVPLFKNFEEVVVLTNNDKKLFDLNYNLKSIVIPNAKSFKSNKKTKLNNKKFLAIGRLDYQKGFDYLIEAMYLFNQKNKEWSLDIFGEGPKKKELLKLIKKYKLNNYINIYPNTQNIMEVYLNHDIYLMTSRAEGFGLVTLEALECGLPVIAFDIPANKEIIKEGISGVLVEKYNIYKFSERMFELISNREKTSYIHNNTKQAVAIFDEKTFANKWLLILK